jgi:hypothetical protein
MIDAKFSMMLGSRGECVTCGDRLNRGDLVRMRPVDGSKGYHVQCGPCAAKELLPLLDAEDKAMRARVAAEDQAQA